MIHYSGSIIVVALGDIENGWEMLGKGCSVLYLLLAWVLRDSEGELSWVFEWEGVMRWICGLYMATWISKKTCFLLIVIKC